MINEPFVINSSEVLGVMEKKGLSRLYPECPRIAVATATCGRAAGAGDVYNALRDRLDRLKLGVSLVTTGCPGLCKKEPLVTLLVPGQARIYYGNMTVDLAGEMLAALAEEKVFLQRALGTEIEDTLLISDYQVNLGSAPAGFGKISELGFFRPQVKLATRNCGYINPLDIYEYIGRGGYRALAKALSVPPGNVIEEVKRSGLRGRGGAGFPTGIKWEIAASAGSGEKYIICNGDEGDPGAYMDRSILEGDPHSVLEGIIIGAYGMNATRGIVYVRAEYPLAVATIEHAIKEARELGLLGQNIMGSGLIFDVEVVKGAGAFVCGEETALIASVEGHAGEPRPRPPFPAQKGLWGEPTCINNVETLANIPLIIKRGGDWYSGFGVGSSKGTKVFSLVGNVKNSGLVEVPMGTSIAEIVLGAGGGLSRGRKLKAVQTGGPSGGCIPASMMDLPVTYESLAEAGTIMGSGGMVAMDERVCMVDLARYYMSFVMEESCGKCIPCRDGTAAILDILTRITTGKGQAEDLGRLAELSGLVKDASFCGLGQTATNPVLSTLKHFRTEYETHVFDQFCPAGVCRSLISFQINPDLCAGCGLCADECSYHAIRGQVDEPRTIDQDCCVQCGACFDLCPHNAIHPVKRRMPGV